MTNPNEMRAVTNAVTAYHAKKLDRELIIQSMHGNFELHPLRCEVTDRLAIELADDLKAIGKIIADMRVGSWGGEL